MSAIESKMAELAARFASRAAQERKVICEAIVAGDRAIVAERAHKLAGLAGMMGHPEITTSALALEAAVEAGRTLEGEGQNLLDLLAAVQPG